MNEHLEKSLVERFQEDLRRFSEVTGKQPSVCVMGWIDFGVFTELCKKHCTVQMQPGEQGFGKRQLLGIDIYEGDRAAGITFGK